MKKISSLVALIISAVSLSYGQSPNNVATHPITITVPEVAKLALVPATGSSTFSMEFTRPSIAGNPIGNAPSDSRMWLNYSSIVTASGLDASRSVNVKIAPDVSGGISFTVQAATISGLNATAFGAVGTPASSITLTTTSDVDPLIQNIGSCYTGVGANKGHMLTYNATRASGSAAYSSLRAGSVTTTVTYTLTDN